MKIPDLCLDRGWSRKGPFHPIRADAYRFTLRESVQQLRGAQLTSKKRFFNSNSDFFVSPFPIWRPYGDLVPGYLAAGMAETSSVSDITLLPYGQQSKDSIAATLDEVAHRNQGLLFRDGIEVDNGGIKACLEDVGVSSVQDEGFKTRTQELLLVFE